ncbi:MAG: YfiR family protein, partial [Phenylobacterium sp.]
MIGSRAQRRRATRGPAIAALIASALTLAAGGACAQGLEFPVKAAFLSKFPAFVTWPTAPAGAPVRLCVVGEDPFGTLLDQTVAGAPAGDRPLVIRRLAVVDHAPGCEVIYAAGSSRQTTAQVLAAVKGQPVLTVTDQAR